MDRFVKEGHYDQRDGGSRGLQYEDDRSSQQQRNSGPKQAAVQAPTAPRDDAKPVQSTPQAEHIRMKQYVCADLLPVRR